MATATIVADENMPDIKPTSFADDDDGKLSDNKSPRGGSISADERDAPLANGAKPDGEKTAFPILLHEIVTDPSTDGCVHWLSCGTRFMISDKKIFANEVLPRFYGHAKFTSFTRRLKRWSFISLVV